MKTKLSYTVRNTRAPGETRDVIVPVIVERLNPVELETVVENCIDRGLIAGLKTTAAHGIAEGVAAQIAREFSQGRGVQFGQYFYGRPYLSGTVDANGRLSSANGINVRLYKGEAFRLTLDDFSFTFDGAGDAVKIDSIYGDTTDAGGNTYGQLVAGAPVKINGRNLYAAGDTDKVLFTEAGGGSTVEVADFATQSADMLSFAWPAGLVAGKTYEVKVERTDVNGVTRTSAEKKVTVVAGETPPGTFTFTGVSTSGGPMGLVNYSQSIQLHGTGLVEEATIEAKPTDSAGEFFAVPGGFMDFDSDELIRLDSEVQVGDMTLWDYLTQTVGISSQHNSVTFRITQDGESKTATATVNFE